MIRPAGEPDIDPILDLWNPVIRDTTITFTPIEKTRDDIAADIARRTYLVAEAHGRFAGFATFGPFRAGPGYARTAELTLFVTDDQRGTGTAAILLSHLETAARASGIHVLIAGMSGENPRAIRFFAKEGYVETARMPELGRKQNRYLDLVFMQKMIGD